MIRRLIDMQASAEYAGPSLRAYGTSEGVRKEWDTRGRSGKTALPHKDKGTFRRTDSGALNDREGYWIGNHAVYESKGGTSVQVKSHGIDVVNPVSVHENGIRQMTGTPREAHNFVKQRYGIHTSAKDLGHAGHPFYR